MGGFSVDCGFNGVRSGFSQGIYEGESICFWEFYGEFDVWIYGSEVPSSLGLSTQKTTLHTFYLQ